MPNNEWIDVNDRLPDGEYYVWAYHPEVGVQQELYCDEFDFIEVGFAGHKATHWMHAYVPQPPKGDDND